MNTRRVALSALAVLSVSLTSSFADAQVPMPFVDPAALASSWVNQASHGAYTNDAPADVDLVAADIKHSRAIDPTEAFVAKRVEIPLVFHIMYDSTLTPEFYDWVRENYFTEYGRLVVPNLIDGRIVTEQSVNTAVEQLNAVYQNYQISFELYDEVSDPVRYHDDSDFFWAYWGVYGDGQMEAMRAELASRYAVDYPNALNVFLVATDFAPFLGYGAFPSDIVTGNDTWSIVLDFRTFPGVWDQLDPGKSAKDYSSLVDVIDPGQLSYAPYNTVLSHEVGHCLGLFHTFTNSTPLGEGDLVDDTPFEAVPFRGDGIQRTSAFADYPIDRNTADDSWYWPNGKDPSDPVRNVMDYGKFHYREAEITKGQADLVFRQFELYAPQFVSHYKPAKPAEDRLFVFADFEKEKLADFQVDNKAKQGKQIPLYVQEAQDASLIQDWDHVGTSLFLQDSASLYVSEDDLAIDDVRQASETSTIAFWFKIGDVSTMNTSLYGLPMTPVFHMPTLGYWGNRSFDVIHNYPWPGYSFLRFFYPTSDGDMRSHYFYELTAVLNEWNHIAITYDKVAGVTYYFNGYQIPSGESFGSAPAWTSFNMGEQVWYGRDAAGNDIAFEAPMNSAVDNLAIYNTALSQQEVLELLYNGAPDGWLKGNYRNEIRRANAAETAAADALFQ